MLLDVRALDVQLGGLPILHDLSLQVDEGEIVSVLGANGVGKTTLMRTLSGLYRPTRGEITFGGQPIHGLSAHAIVQAGLAQAPEGRQIFADMTVDENLVLGGIQQPAKASTTRAAMLEMFPVLQERLKQKAGTLSGGEQQMLCIARALMSEPRLLLLDEPSLGLAPQLVKRIFTLIRDIRKAGTTVLLVEQNARAALGISDRAYVMEHGRIVLQGAGKELADNERVREAYLGGSVA